MAELTTVYRARPEEVARVVTLLRRRNLEPVVVDHVGRAGTYRGHSHDFGIAVPVTQRDTALAVLAEMEQKDGARLAPLVRVANKVVLVLIAALATVAVVALLDRSGKWLALAWGLLTAVVAVALVRWAWRRTPKA